MNTQERIDYIEQCINENFSPTALEIIDDSHLHAGHASAKGGGHFRVNIVSSAFAGQSMIQRHRMVYSAMGDAMKSEIHALSIKAYTPDET
jgi:BolA protein